MEWNADPIIFQAGPLAIRYYSLMFLIGFVSMDYYVKKQFQKYGKDPLLVTSLTNHIILGMLIGSRLFHCFFYDPQYYFSNPLEILMVWKGGLASHGGFLGVVIATWIFMKKNSSLKFLWIMDIIAGPCMFVAGLIRLGNFFNSEIYGHSTDLPWGVIFRKVDDIARHPAQLYESFGYFCISAFLIFLRRKNLKQLKSGSILALAVIISFAFRFFVEFFKDNQSSLSDGLAINMGQILSLVAIPLGIFLYLRVKRSQQTTK